MISSEETALLYDRLSVALYRYILRITGNRQAAEDILHDAFISFIEHSDRYDIVGRDPAPLLFKIAKNRSLDWIRNRKREVYEANEPVSPADRVDESFQKDETAAALEHCVNLLDEKHKMAYNLRRDNDLTYPELAEISGIPERTLKRRVAEAIAQIAECLKKGGYLLFLAILWHVLQVSACII